MIAKNIIIVMLGLFIFSDFAGAQNCLPEGAEEGIFSLYYKGFKKEVTVMVYKDSIYIPFYETLSFLRIYYRLTDSNNIINGYLINENMEYEVNLDKECFYNVKNSYLKFSKSQYIRTPIEIYVTPYILSKLFLIDVSIFTSKLLINIKSDIDLPVLEEEERYNKYANLNSDRYLGEDKILPVIYERNWKILDGGILNYSLNGVQSKYSQGISYSTNLGIQLLGGELQYDAIGSYYSTSKTSTYDQNFRWRYSFTENKYISQVSIGYLTNMPLRTSSIIYDVLPNRILKGIQVSNENTIMPTVFNTFMIEGQIEPGWQVELYVNNQLAAQTQSDNIGYYNFKLPARYGYTNIELKFYGPKGEFLTKTEVISLPSEFIAPGTIKYNINAGQDVSDKKYAANGRISIGLTNWLTNSTDIEKIEKTNKLSIVNNTSLRIYRGVILSSMYSPKNFVKSGIRFGFDEYGVYDIIYSKNLSNMDSVQLNSNQLNTNSIELNFGLPRLFSLPINLTFRGKKSFSDLVSYTSLSSSLGIYIDKFSLYANYNAYINENKQTNEKLLMHTLNPRIDYSWYDKPGFLSFLKNTRFSVGGKYDLNQKKVSDMDLSLQQEIFSGVNFTVRYNKNFGYGSSGLNISLMLNLPYFRANTSMQSVEMSDNSYSEDISGIVGFNSNDSRFYLSNVQGLYGYGYGAAVVRFFIDRNNNGVYDKGEEEIPEADFNIPNAQIENDKSGERKVYNLIPAARYNLFIKKNSFKNPLILPKYEEFSFIADPYSFKVIDVPCYMTGAIEGTAYKMVGEKKVEQSGIRVHLINLDKSEEQTINLFSDGSFYKIGVIPGKYKVYIDSMQLQILNCTSNPDFINFEVKSTAEGDDVSGLDFLLIPKPKVIAKKEEKTLVNEKVPENREPRTGLNEAPDKPMEKVVQAEIAGEVVLFDFDIKDDQLIRKNNLSGIKLRITDGKDSYSSITDSAGKFNFINLRPSKWTLGVLKDNLPKGYKSEKIAYTLDIKASMKQELDIKVIPYDKDNSVVPGELKTFNINDVLSDFFREYLDQVAEMAKYTKLFIVINSHSDSSGTVNETRQRSRNNAKKVKDYLISKNVDSRIIQTYSFGARQPIAPNDNPENREKNRRIEILVMKFNN
jgi:hypothetical protein